MKANMTTHTQTSPNQSNQHAIFIQYLDEFGKQISTRKNINGIEEQLSSLSRAYNVAQQKLLETEKSLMNESILIEKQRSIIELYKYILREDMEDEGILTFIQHLEDKEQDRREIYEQLTELKTLLNRKKLNNCKKTLSGCKNLRELRNEVERLQSQQRNLSEDSVSMSSENQDLRDRVKQLTQQMANCRQQLQVVNLQIASKTLELQKSEAMLKVQRDQIMRNNQKIGYLIADQNKYLASAAGTQKLLQIIDLRLNITANKASKESTSQPMSSKESTSLPMGSKEGTSLWMASKENGWSSGSSVQISSKYCRQLDQKLGRLQKYREQYKKMKLNYRECELHKRQISLLKLFLSEEALRLVKEYEEHSLDCLETEIRNLAVLQKNKLIRLQHSEREVWKYRLQLMKQADVNQGGMQYGGMQYRGMQYRGIQQGGIQQGDRAGLVNSCQPPSIDFSNKLNILSTMYPLSASVSNSHKVSQFEVEL